MLPSESFSWSPSCPWILNGLPVIALLAAGSLMASIMSCSREHDSLQGWACGCAPRLGWLRFGELPLLVGRYCSYLLPMQTGGTTQVLVFKTLRMMDRPALYIQHTVLIWWYDTALGICMAKLMVMTFVFSSDRLTGWHCIHGSNLAGLYYRRSKIRLNQSGDFSSHKYYTNRRIV